MAQLKSTSVVGNLAVTGNVVASQIIKNDGTDDDILLGSGDTTSLSSLIASISGAQATADNADGKATQAQNEIDELEEMVESLAIIVANNEEDIETKLATETQNRTDAINSEATTRANADATKVDDQNDDITTWTAADNLSSSLTIGMKTGDGILSLRRRENNTAAARNKWVNLRVENADGLTENVGLNLYLPTVDGTRNEGEQILATRAYAVHKTGDTMTGRLTVPALTISSTSGISHIKFSRDTDNYLHASEEGGSIALCSNSTLALENSALVANKTSVYPGKNNTYSLGTSTHKWKEVYVKGQMETGTIKSTSISNGESTYDKILMASDAGLIGYRTKKEFVQDLAISNVYTYKGAVLDLNALKQIQSADVGDVYFITTTYESWACKQAVIATTGNNYETYWSNLGHNVDLSGYMTLNTTQTITGQKTFSNNLIIDSTSNTNMSTPALHILHTGPATNSAYADLMILSGYKSAPYGFKFSTYGDGTAIIQSQRISGGTGEKFDLSLNPNGGDVLVGERLVQGIKNKDSSIVNMNQFSSDLYVKGSGSAPNIPKIAGFYLGKSQSDENRHMDIVSGDRYSYIDFNGIYENEEKLESKYRDFTMRLIVDVYNGYTDMQWASDVSNKKFNIQGNANIAQTLSLSNSATFEYNTLDKCIDVKFN